jgi:hypothetical protein
VIWFRPLRDGGHRLELTPILPSEWDRAKKDRCWSRWFDASWPEYRPSIAERLTRTANDRDHLWW